MKQPLEKINKYISQIEFIAGQNPQENLSLVLEESSHLQKIISDLAINKTETDH